MGSAKPDDPSRIRIDDHIADALAVLDHAEIDRALLVAWSYGVNVSFELTREHPDRVAGLVMCAGVPGGTLDSAFAPLLIPRKLRKPIGLAVLKAGELVGPQLNALAKFVPVNRTTADVMRYTGMIMPSARSEDIVPWLDSFIKQDFSWYFHLFPAAGEHERIDPSFVDVPVTVAAGGMDTLTSMLDVVAFAKEIEHAQVHVLRGTHFIPLEFPDEIMAMIDDVLLRSKLAPEQVVEQRTSVVDIRTYDGQSYYEHHATAFRRSRAEETIPAEGTGAADVG
ncbi:MAG: pimeloyl-ACP methyl ester carboxylesterase [Actinomycetes bacterium]|jgi:3-oxoadipate enol-lactonase